MFLLLSFTVLGLQAIETLTDPSLALRPFEVIRVRSDSEYQSSELIVHILLVFTGTE